MNEQLKLSKVLSKLQKFINANKNREALALANRQKGRLAIHPDLLKIKARALTGLERYRDSSNILQDLQVKLPDDTGVLAGLAYNFNLMKAHDSAIKYAEKAVNLEPRNLGLLLNLASTYRANQMTGSAVTVLRRAENLAPNQPNVVLLLSQLLLDQGEYLEALGLLARLPDSPLRLMLLFDCYCKLNWYEQAQKLVGHIEKTLANQDDYYKALFITRLQQLGDISKVKALLKGPAPFQSPKLLLAFIQSTTQDANSLLQLSERVDKTNFEEDEKMSLVFALSEKLFAHQENDRAFELLNAANQMQTIPENEQQEINRVFESIEKSFLDWKDKNIPASSSAVPIFVLGMPRSGTTLVESILASHSQVFGAGETNFLDKNLNGKSDSAHNHSNSIRYLEKMNTWDDDEIREISSGYLQHLKQHSSEARYIVDKMPHNFLHLGVIRKIFPHAKIIHCIRNPVANCLSIYKQHFTNFHTYSTDLNFLSEYYKKYRKLMSFWNNNVSDLGLIEIEYESLVTNFEPTVRRLLSDCELSFEESCLHYQEQNRVVNTLSTMQVRNKIYQTSLKAWENQEEYIKPLLNAFPQDID